MSEINLPDHSASRFPPVFATNNAQTGETVAAKLRVLMDGSVSALRDPPNLAIATAYLNVGGFALVAEQLERFPHARLLLGAEPETGVAKPQAAEYLSDPGWIKDVLANHVSWLRAERDLTSFTLADDTAARRMVEWLESSDDNGSPRVEVRRFTRGFLHGKAFIVDHPQYSAVVAGSSNFTYAGLMTNRELNLGYPNVGETHLVQEWFNDLWEESEPFDLAALYAERWEEHSPYLIFMRMLRALYGDQGADEKLEEGLALTAFQRDGVARAMRLLDQNGGVLIADEVGLGKTFIAGEIVRRAVEADRQRVLIICPAAVKETVWEDFLDRYGFSRRARVMSYDQLRLGFDDPDTGEDFQRELDDHALVVIDEAHNLRNASTQRGQVVTSLLGGKYPKKTMLLTATPVNNSLFDLYTLVSYFIKNDGYFARVGIPSIRDYIKTAQAIDPESLSPRYLFDLMDQVAVRRTRRFVKRNYKGDTFRSPTGKEIPIKFPTPRVRRLEYELDERGNELLDRVLAAISILEGDPLVVSFQDRHYRPDKLSLARYTTSAYLRQGDIEQFQVSNSGLLRSALLKRLESSPAALAKTFSTMIGSHEAFLSALDLGKVLSGDALSEWTSSSGDDLDEALKDLDDEKRGTQVLDAKDFHAKELREDVVADMVLLAELRDLAEALANDGDHKAARLIQELRQTAAQARSLDRSGISAADRRKTVIFSTFTDTVTDLHAKVRAAIEGAGDQDPLADFKGRVAPAIYGSKSGTHQEERARELKQFAPRTAGELSREGEPISTDRYDILVTTDVLSEGVNLQQAGRMINYDLPWNPMRLVQRSGRIDRIGSEHDYIQVGCFFPSDRLSDFLHLEEILQRKLAYADAAVGVGEVLPGQKSKTEVVLNDTREQINLLHAERPDLFEGEGDLGALSGEEYRRRLFQATKDDRYFSDKIALLPYGSGSGFISPVAEGNGFVFCLKMGSQDKPWFRYVPVDGNWDPIKSVDEAGNVAFEVLDDTLTSLSAADPGGDETARVLPSQVYNKAFRAWEVASDHAYRAWLYLTNPNNLTPELEKAFRDAAEFVYRHGSFLGNDKQAELAERLSGRWPAEVKRAVREVLNQEGLAPRGKVERLAEIADEFGLALPERVEALPAISKDEVRLIAWMAVAADQSND